MNARQQITAATYGTSLSGDFDFDDYGYPKHSKAHVSGIYRQDYRYSFNTVTGNLNSRQNYLISKSESFTYDNLDRLLTVTGPQNLIMDYAANGNILTKSDVGTNTFGYNHSTKPYALTDLETASGLVPEALQTVTYTSFEQPLVITESPYLATFTYNSEGQRAKMEVKQSGNTILTRWYAGSRYIKETAGAVTKEYWWLGGDAYSAPILAVKQGSTTTYYYILRDHLGTITHLTNTSGTVQNRYSFDAWGRQRSPESWEYLLPAQTDLLPGRGFTGHEHLSWFNLVNMNGRLYDPVVGRFLSADNYVQAPGFTQSFNRYSYCLNNPLKYVDPSGEKVKWWHPVAAMFGTAAWGSIFKSLQGEQVTFGEFMGSYAVNAASFIVGAGVGSAVASQFGGITSFASGLASGAAGGFSGGFISGAGNSWLNGSNFSTGLLSGLEGGGIGALSGGIIGGVSNGISNTFQGNNFWTGQPTDKTVAKVMAARIVSPKLSANIESPTLNFSYNPKLGTFAMDSELQFDGNQLSWYDNMSDGSQSLRESWDAVSGPWGNGSLPEGQYSATNLKHRTNLRMVRDGVGFSVDLEPQFPTARNLLRIHPDGHSKGLWWLNNGTEGCIGLQTGGNALKKFSNQISNYFYRVNSSINLFVNY